MIRNNKLVYVNKDQFILQRSEFESSQPLLTLPPLPRENNISAQETESRQTDNIEVTEGTFESDVQEI